MTEVLDTQSQADPKFQTNVLFTRATGKFLRSLLEPHPDLADAKPPLVRACQRLMNRLGFRIRFVRKAKPLKKIQETEAIFTHLDRLHERIEFDPTVLRISVDTKAKVAVGPYCRQRIGKQAFAALAKRLQRSQTLPRWSVMIEPLREGGAPSG